MRNPEPLSKTFIFGGVEAAVFAGALMRDRGVRVLDGTPVSGVACLRGAGVFTLVSESQLKSSMELSFSKNALKSWTTGSSSLKNEDPSFRWAVICPSSVSWVSACIASVSILGSLKKFMAPHLAGRALFHQQSKRRTKRRRDFTG
ncbi:MAG: hypothetical protein IIC64_06460 [SAR324 cluster bacterium]|nr:hypothetical protein [SAR324 cluster bacterium]